jgi:basic membrane protein A
MVDRDEERRCPMTSGSKRRPTFLLTALAAVALVVAACGGGDSGGGGGGGGGAATTAGGGASAPKEIKVGVALFGQKNDKGFNQAALAGVNDAATAHPELKVTAVLENRTTTQRGTDAVETLAPINQVMVGVSATFGPIFDVEADKFPNTTFITIAGYGQQLRKNVTGFANDWGAPTYVAGAIAANMTKSNVVGYVGGAEIPPTTQGDAGFAAGAKSVKPDIKVVSNIIGDFNDVAKAKAATAAMITDGADVIFPFLDAAVAGTYAAAKESGKNPALFKLTVPDCEAYGNMVGTGFVDNQAAALRMLDEHVKGTLEPGAVFTSLESPDLQTLKLCPKFEQNAQVAKVTKDTIDAVNSGQVKLPAAAINPRPKYAYKEGFDGETVTPSGSQ